MFSMLTTGPSAVRDQDGERRRFDSMQTHREIVPTVSLRILTGVPEILVVVPVGPVANIMLETLVVQRRTEKHVDGHGCALVAAQSQSLVAERYAEAAEREGVDHRTVLRLQKPLPPRALAVVSVDEFLGGFGVEPLKAVRIEPVAVLIEIDGSGCAQPFERRQADVGLGLPPGRGQRWKQDGHQQCQDGDHHEQLDHGEAPFSLIHQHAPGRSVDDTQSRVTHIPNW